MLEFINISLICVIMDADSSYLEQIFLFEDSYSQKKAKVTSYYAEVHLVNYNHGNWIMKILLTTPQQITE